MLHIAFEGIDGCGKSTQLTLLSERLQSSHISFSTYSYTAKNNFYGSVIRWLYATHNDPSMFRQFLQRRRSLQEMLYALSARTNFSGISKDTSEYVLCDRSVLTAYASHLHRLPEWYVGLLSPSTVPDIIFFFDIEPEKALSRISSREERFLDEDLESLIEFRDAFYYYLQGVLPSKLTNSEVVFFDGEQEMDSLHAEVYEYTKGHLL